MSHDFLNDVERDQIKSLVSHNKTLLGAIKKIILAGVYFNGVVSKGGGVPDWTRNFMLGFGAEQDMLTDEQIGAKTRALTEAVRIVELGFNELEKFKEIKNIKEKAENPAR